METINVYIESFEDGFIGIYNEAGQCIEPGFKTINDAIDYCNYNNLNIL